MSKRQGLFRGLGEIEKSSNLKISIMLFLYMEFLHKKRSFDPHIGVLCKFVHDILSKVQFTESSGSCKRIIFRTWRNMDYTEKDFKVMEKKSVKSVYKKI